MAIIETQRLLHRELELQDSKFILELLNDPAFIANIADRKVRTIADAEKYIQENLRPSYSKFGFGLYLVELKDSKTPIGISGLIKRDALKDIDIGFAFLPQFCGKGYAYESAQAILAYGFKTLDLNRIIAIVNPDNENSIKLLKKIGLTHEGMIQMPGETREINLFGIDAS